LAPVAHVLARIASCDHADAVRGGVLGVLLAHHRVGAGRERSTCEDPGRLTRPDRPRGELPGGDALDHREHDLTLGARPRHVAAASGVAVHGRIVPGGEVDRASYVHGEHHDKELAQRTAHCREPHIVQTYTTTVCICGV